ncbi:type II toxin-antitoxin system RelE/ParE family toxin [Rhizobium sp. XQZ8]|uniref:type II toxin-antitoxin system RelE/ParE family toxin n=1 Tax=Rhizobium populisoli TaxID=2859785 RepID=UPI001C66490A|nr:type II toxin-antitoxin system RelE/ParE family toxin [Rhizobium populisoli]
MKLLWTLQARSDRRAIFKYIQKDNPEAAANLDDQFVKAAEQLARHPQSGRSRRVAGTREVPGSSKLRDHLRPERRCSPHSDDRPHRAPMAPGINFNSQS